MPDSRTSPRSRRFTQAALFALLPFSTLAAPVAQLDEVVVTARRQAVPTLATPLSIG